MIESLKHAPADLPDRYRKMAERAANGFRKGNLKAAVKLHCVQCMGWSFPDARDCEARECPLWIQSRMLFGKTPHMGASGSPKNERSSLERPDAAGVAE